MDTVRKKVQIKKQRVISKFKSGWWDTLTSLDKEHIIALCYICLIFIPLIISVLVLGIFRISKSRTVIWLLSILVSIFTSYFSYKIMRFLFADILKLRLMVGVAELFLLVFSFQLSLSWIYFVVGNLYNILSSTLPYSTYPLISSGKLLVKLSTDLHVFASIMSGLSIIVGLSFMLNFFLPQKLNEINIAIKLKFVRLGLKILYLALLIFVTVVLFAVNKSNFVVVGLFYSAFMWVFLPEKILRIFSSISNDNVSEVMKNRFIMIKWFVTLIFLSWAISVYFFSNNKSTRILEFEALAFVLILISVIFQVVVTNKKDLFDSWFSSNSESVDKTKKDN